MAKIKTEKTDKKQYGALLSVEAGVAMFAGYGRLDRRVPSEDAAIPGSVAARYNESGKKADCVVLSSGEVVWASECAAFLRADEMKSTLEKLDQVKQASITNVREQRRREAASFNFKPGERRPGPEAGEEDLAAVEAERLARHEALHKSTLAELLGGASATTAESNEA